MSVGLRSLWIDAIRGVAILLVLLHHFNIAYRLDDTLLAGVLGWDLVRAVARNGNYGVTVFFVVSGYLITSNTERRWASLAHVGARAFYTLRAARILPCLLLLLAMVNLLAAGGVAIFQNRPQGGEPVSFWLVNFASLTFWMNVLVGRHGWFNYPLGVLWSLSVEEVFYLAFPLLCLLLRREARLLAFWAAVIVAGPLYRLAHQGDDGGYLYAYAASFDGIAIGCCTALLARKAALRGPATQFLQGPVAAAMAVLYLWRPIGETNVLGVTGMALGTAVLLLGVQERPADPVRRGSRPLVMLGWLGQLSYELYLFHLVVLGLMRTAFPPRAASGDAKLLLLAAFLVLSAGLATLISRFYAEPLNRRIRLLGLTQPKVGRAAT